MGMLDACLAGAVLGVVAAVPVVFALAVITDEVSLPAQRLLLMAVSAILGGTLSGVRHRRRSG